MPPTTNTVAALYIGGPFSGLITEIPADSRAAQHVQAVDEDSFFSYTWQDAHTAPMLVKTKLVRYELREDLFEDTVLCAEGMSDEELIAAHDEWRASETQIRLEKVSW